MTSAINHPRRHQPRLAENNRPCHLIFQLPEIVEQIIQHVAPHRYQHFGPGTSNSSYQQRALTKCNKELLPCLYVNWLWHDCASRLTWRHISFEDTKQDYEQLLNLTSTLTDVPIHQLKQSPGSAAVTDAANALALAMAGSPSPPLMPSLSTATSSSTVHAENPAKLNLVSTYRKRIRSLTLRKIKERNINEPLQLIGKSASSLLILDIYICDYVTNAALIPFIDHGRLTYLSLAGCQRVTDEAISHLAKSCRQLEHLDLRACGLVSDRSISEIALQCPRLRHLNVGRVRDRHHITDRSIELIAKHTSVCVLGLAGCDVSDASLIMLAKYRRAGIERISINNCYRATNQTIRSYVQYCPKLSVFEMKECHHINDWSSVADLVQRKVLLTLCDQQTKACNEWARRHGKTIDVKAPVK
ncbi:RNI-like protein [Hesseltinella vesiculosa]|uniref:RNI-like protein n=1 Tax=Hesseltinella vesiculosa TaxID=101127 RepID=A0A1X2GUZ4_9FUNG|nr:RNI-like protein [Hesseltinella vesiculosa]